MNVFTLAGRQETYHDLAPSEKATFTTLFRSVCENLDETDRYLAMYLAATNNTTFVENVVRMVSRVRHRPIP